MSSSVFFFFAVPIGGVRAHLELMLEGQTSVDTMAVTTQTFPVIFMTKIASLPKVAFPLNPPEQLVSSCAVGAAEKNKQTYQLFGIEYIFHYSPKISTYTL